MKSFIVAVIITAVLCGLFMGIFEKSVAVYLNRVPTWLAVVLLIVFFIGYCVALYWGISGIMREQRVLNFFGIVLSVLGIGAYIVMFQMNNGKGKERPGQFDHSFESIGIEQQQVLEQIVRQAGLSVEDINFAAYWNMSNNPSDLAVCVQDGNVIALQVKNHPVTDMQLVSRLQHLNWLILDNCSVTNITHLVLPELQRLNVSHNQLTSLAGLGKMPNVVWLDFSANPVTDSSALDSIKGPYFSTALQ